MEENKNISENEYKSARSLSDNKDNNSIDDDANLNDLNDLDEINLISNQNPLYNKKESSDSSRIFDKMQNDKVQKKRLSELISYLKVQKQPFHEAELSNIFDRLDIDGDHSISSQEIKRFLQSLRTPVNDFYIDKIVKDFDINKDGDIEKKEFLERMKNQANKGYNSDLTELLEIFKLFDANHDQKICDQDLLNILKALGENFDAETCKEMMKYLGDANGQINFSKFFDLVKDEGRKESYI